MDRKIIVREKKETDNDQIKNILEKQYDHTTVVAADDPELDTFKLLSETSQSS